MNQTNEALYSKRYLLKALKKNRLPHSYMTLMKYEKAGVVNQPVRAIGFGNGKHRLYTQAEIDENVNRVRAYQKGELKLQA
jgi:hypothetical protein